MSEPTPEQQPEDVQPEADHQADRDERVRGRLREVEAERDALHQRVTTFQRREYERLAQSVVGASAVQWMSDEVPLTEDGEVDEDAVLQAAAELREKLRQAKTGAHPTGDLGARKIAPTKQSASWGSLLMGKSR